MNRQDIKTMIDRLDDVTIDGWCIETDQPIIDSAIYMLEELGNIVQNLQKEVLSLKQELKEINKAIDDPAVDLTMTASECILRMKKDIVSLKHEILHLEAMIDD